MVLSESNVRTGDVWLVDFDRGVVETFGAVINSEGDRYVIKDMPGVSPPPDFEGIPVYFSFPEETVDPKILPSFVIRRDEQVPALSRWHLGNQQYRIPSPGASPVDIVNPRTGDLIASGFDEYEEKPQAVPYDLMYTIQIRARYRNNLKAEAMKMLHYVMKRYQPYTTVFIKDSEDAVRSYTGFTESPAPIDVKPDVVGRQTGFNITLRIEAELDLNDPFVMKSLSSLPSSTFTPL